MSRLIEVTPERIEALYAELKAASEAPATDPVTVWAGDVAVPGVEGGTYLARFALESDGSVYLHRTGRDPRLQTRPEVIHAVLATAEKAGAL